MNNTGAVTLTAHMFNRTIVTEHADVTEARARITKIAMVQGCRLDGTDTEGQFVLQVWAADHYVDDPRVDWTFGTYAIKAA
jgi:hypothetical protein